MTKINPVLKIIMRKIYKDRRALNLDPKTVVRHEISDGQPMCEIWFMTEGCSYDRDGGCTMCNYGKGHLVDESIILTQLKCAFQALPEANYNLVINPSGSFLDKHEVSKSLLESIYSLLDSVSFESLTVECRADVLERESIFKLNERFPNKRISIEIGVETFDPWLLRNSVNKGITIDQICEAVQMIHESKLTAVANIGLGLPFINERRNISASTESIEKAFAAGFDTVILFPYQVKPGTLLEYLFLNNQYRCISLWSLIDVLKKVPEQYLPKVNISWYRNYYTDKTKVISSPTTCSTCNEIVLDLLDTFKAEPSATTLKKLVSFKCDCQAEWKHDIANQIDTIDFDMVTFKYRQLAKHYDISPTMLEDTLKEMEDTLYADN